MIELVVNGRNVAVDAGPDTPLVLVLRDHLGLRGVRAGCAIGECGVCAVHLDGRSARSCQVTVAEAAGARVTTPEGLGTPERPHPVQQVFLDEQAAQCGYCVNGMIMSVAADPIPDTEEALQEALAGHLCRCGAQYRILRAARRLAGLPVPPCGDLRPAPPAVPGPDADPPALANAPLVEDWLRPRPDGTIEVRTGRVELGQGVRTALGQVVAAELGVPVEQVVVRSAATGDAPDEGYTAGSMSLEYGGTALARAAAAYRRLTTLGLPPTGPITDDDRPRWTGKPLGDPIPRDDLVPKLTGAPAYVHDLVLPGMVHARAVLPPTYDGSAAPFDEPPGLVATVHDGGLVLVIAERQEDVVTAVTTLRTAIRWTDTGAPEPSQTSVTQPVAEDPGVDEAPGQRLEARYRKPFEAHASVAPSCAVAHLGNGHLTVWTHSQGPYPLRRELARLYGLDESRLTVRHADGPGCYGHNGADDAAAFAARAALAVPGRPVRFQFSVADEFAWEPYGTAMSATVSANLVDGRVSAWRYAVDSGPQTGRPVGNGERLAASWLRAGGPRRPRDAGSGEGGVRNADPLYAFPLRRVVGRYAPVSLRTSSLRTLGAYFNVFAIESFLDELAEAAGRDPLEFRLAHLDDERARAVLETVAAVAGWEPRVGASGRGRGLAFARYKNTKAYVAQVLDADVVEGAIVVRRVWTVCDAGVVVNPDGLRNQLEGGTLQGLSRALHEEVTESTVDWRTYPVLRFAEVPELHTTLLDRPGSPPLGAGEASTPVTSAALANAVHDRTGRRLRELPLRLDGA